MSAAERPASPTRPVRSVRVGGPAAAAALLVAACFAALALPGARLGLGLAIAVVLVAGAAAGMAGRRPQGVQLGWGALAVALAAQAVLRDDAFLVFLDLLGAGWAATLSLGAAARWAPLLRAAAGPWRHLVRGFGLALVTLQGLVPRPQGTAFGAVARGGALACGLVLAFGALFVSADGAFAELADDTLSPGLDAADLLGRVGLGLGAATLAGGLVVAAAPGALGPGAPGPLARRGLERAEWAMPLGALVVLFGAFVAIQLSVLFGGRAYVLETTGLGYGEYARKGFVQLLLVAGLVLGVVAAAGRLARRTGRAEERLLRALLGALCLLTGVILASALHRLQLVEDAYGFTRVRLAGHAVVLVLGATFALVLLGGVWRPVARHLPRLVVALGLAGLLLHSASAPDARIAAENVERLERTGQFDDAYAAGLGADAVSALTRLDGARGRCVLAAERARLAEGDGGWAGANRARSRARAALARVPAAGSDASCRERYRYEGW